MTEYNIRSKNWAMVYTKTILLVILVFFTFVVKAQYPVQVIPQITSPASLNLSDYYSSTIPKLTVTLTNRDLLRPDLSVKLRVSISNNSISLTTDQTKYYQPIILDAGIPKRLVGTDLAQYLSPNNLNFQGISKQEYLKTGKLPEGLYNFCFEVIETNTNRILSQSNSCALAWISLSDPPLLNTPLNNAQIIAKDPSFIPFNWTSRHHNSANNVSNTSYEFQLVEILDNMVDPNAVFASSRIMYTEIVRTSALLYGPSQPPLIVGKRYAWRVRALPTDLTEDYDNFRNNGYSDIYSFYYTPDLPEFFIEKFSMENNALRLKWNKAENHDGFYFVQLGYRGKLSQKIATTNTYLNIPNLNQSKFSQFLNNVKNHSNIVAHVSYFSPYGEISTSESFLFSGITGQISAPKHNYYHEEDYIRYKEDSTSNNSSPDSSALTAKEQKPASNSNVEVNGGINAALITYSGKSKADRNPNVYDINGNLNFKLFKVIDVPVSINLTNAGNNLNLPLTPSRISVSPSYKSLTAHIGDLNLSYSPYTLHGHQFTGAGIDIDPKKGKLTFRSMYGRFQRGVEYDSSEANQNSAYERWGLGSKLLYSSKDYNLGVNFFTAKDKISSINTLPDAIGINPQQNIVGSFQFALRPFKGFEFKTEYAVSALTSELRDTTFEASRTFLLYNNFFSTNNSTYYAKARKMTFTYGKKKSRVGVGYEKIDPGYRTLGAYFFANDLENLTASYARIMLKNKLNLNFVAGVQRDDLDDSKSGTNNRIVGNLILNFIPNDKFNISTNYSNFRTYMCIKSQYQFINEQNQYQSLDTFDFTQITQNLNVTTRYVYSDKKTSSRSLLANISLQDAYSEQSGNKLKDNDNIFYNLSVSHAWTQKTIHLTLLTSYLTTYNSVGSEDFVTQGPAISLSNSFAQKRVKLSLKYNYNNTASSNKTIEDVQIHNIRIGLNMTLLKKHNFLLSFMHQDKDGVSNHIGNVSYNYSF